jgi:YD repeat-containing protein
MRAFLAFLALMLLPLPGCGPEGDDGPNSRDFGPQPWPGPCWLQEYRDGDFTQWESEFTWEDSLLVQRTTYFESQINNCSKYYYNESGRLIHMTYHSGCAGTVGRETTYEWNENGQLSSIDYTSYDTDGSTLISRSRTIHTYGPNDELTEKLSQDQDLDTGEWMDSGFTRYFYDDLGRLVRVETWDIEGGVEELSRADGFLYEEEQQGYYSSEVDLDGDGTIDSTRFISYRENGLYYQTLFLEDETKYYQREFDDNWNFVKAEYSSGGDLNEVFFSYDCWE